MESRNTTPGLRFDTDSAMDEGEAEDGSAALIDIPLEVDCTGDGHRLDRYLVRRFGRLSRHRVHKMIAAGRVQCVDSGEVLHKKSGRLREGQHLLIRRPAPDEPELPEQLELIHSDEDLLVINKPGGLAVHPTARYHNHTLTAMLRREFGEGHGWELAHRLDRDTTGVLLVGRNRGSATVLKQAFFQRRIAKAYVAVVHGRIPGPLELDGAIGPAKASEVRIKMGLRSQEEGGLPALTLAEPVAYAEFRGRPVTVVFVRPKTGRTHQIRVHLDAAGYPLVGDKLYGQPEDKFIEVADGHRPMAEYERELGLSCHALHAYAVALEHPVSGDACEFRATWPGALSSFMADQQLAAWVAQRFPRKWAEA